jgi:hypothetical protein
MRALVACVLLAACATGSTLTPAQRLAGCWINRDAGASRMRWSETPDSGGSYAGSKTTFGIAGTNSTEHYTLSSAESGWRLCRTDAADAGHCWAVAQGEGGSLTGGRAFIDGSSDNLRIAVIGDGPERVVFQGHREACRN